MVFSAREGAWETFDPQGLPEMELTASSRTQPEPCSTST